MVVRFRACSFFICVPFFHLFLFRVVWFHNRVPLGPVPGIIQLYDVLYTWHVFIRKESCCCCCCCRCSVPVLLQLLLFVIVCWKAKTVAGSLYLIPSTSFFFLFIQTLLIFNVCNPWQYCRIYGLDLPILHPR